MRISDWSSDVCSSDLIISKSSGRNWATELYNPWPGVMDHAPASKNYAGGFGVDLMLKDLGLAAESALNSRASVPLGELARNLDRTEELRVGKECGRQCNTRGVP